MTRFTTLLTAAALAALAIAPAASADSIAYVAGDGNVHLVTPDGSRDKPLTSNGTTDDRYRSPSQLDDGRVMALKRADGSTSFAIFLRRDDGQQIDAWLLPKSGVGGFSPFTGAQASPDGGMVVYDYRHFDCATNPCNGSQRVGFVAGPGQTNPCLINCHIGYLAPRWLPGTPYAAMVDSGFDAAYVQKQGSAFPVGWFQYGEGISIYGLDVRADRIVTQVAAGEDEYMVVEKMTAPAPAVPQSQCSVSMPDNARPRLSPDGSMVAWSAPEGVMVSPTPATTGGTTALCQLAPKLVAPGGSQPDWGIADVPAPPAEEKQPETQPEAPKKGNTQKDGSDGAKLIPGPVAAQLEKVLDKGLRIGYRCSGACRVKATATVSKGTARSLGLGSAKTKVGAGRGSLAKAGSGSVLVVFGARAKAKLEEASNVPLSIALTVTDPSGGKRKLTRTVILKG
jgi:hypothetical protein